LMSVVNAAEVWYIKSRRSSAPDADKAIGELKQIGIQFVEVDWELAHEAGRFKARGRMSFADCFAAALAKHRKASLVTGDLEFQQVKKEITISWLVKT
jgi:predicted nucleic acid-binding protein